MQLVVQVNSQRENQSDPSQTEWQSLVPAKNKTNQKVADPQKKVPWAWGISDGVTEQNSRHKPM